jgi:hypothetical protein
VKQCPETNVTRYVPFIGALGDRRYSPSLSLTSALEGGEWSASRPALDGNRK